MKRTQDVSNLRQSSGRVPRPKNTCSINAASGLTAQFIISKRDRVIRQRSVNECQPAGSKWTARNWIVAVSCDTGSVLHRNEALVIWIVGEFDGWRRNDGVEITFLVQRAVQIIVELRDLILLVTNLPQAAGRLFILIRHF